MNSNALFALGALAFLMLGGKKRPREVHGTVTPLDDELIQIRPSARAPAPSAPTSLEDELAAQDAPPVPFNTEQVPSSPPAARAPGGTTDELFAATAAHDALMPPPSATVPPTQKEQTPWPAAPAQPTQAAPSAPSNAPPNVSPVLQPHPLGPQIPAGYDPAKARAGASAIASHLATKGPAGYSHAQLKIWQKQAALTADGVYGGSTRGALIAFGVKNPPRPFFQPVATIPYVPPEQRT